jgi:protein-tyrosine phosphatase
VSLARARGRPMSFRRAGPPKVAVPGALESEECEGSGGGGSAPPSTAARRGRPMQLESLSVSMDCSEMLPFLYLGAKGVSEDSESLRSLGILYIINCTTEAPNHFEKQGMHYLQVAVNDDASANIHHFFSQSGRFIEEARRHNGKVLVHCTMGMSRSSTIVIAYLMQYKGMLLADAMNMAKDRRAMVSPNSGFMKQLIDFEAELFGKRTVDLEAYKKCRFADVSQYALR